jgi:hypothetical protein
VSLVEQELLTLPEHLSSTPVCSWVHVTRSLVLYVCFVDRCLSICTFSFGHCVVCSSSIFGFGLPLWYRRFYPQLISKPCALPLRGHVLRRSYVKDNTRASIIYSISLVNLSCLLFSHRFFGIISCIYIMASDVKYKNKVVEIRVPSTVVI